MEQSNLVIITSCLETKYSDNMFTIEERFNQTLNTIECVRKYMKNTSILFIEASNCNDIYKNIIKKLCDFYYDISTETDTINYCIHGHKSLGDTYITLKAIEYIQTHHLTFNICYKLSGRYYPQSDFNYDLINKEIPTFKDSAHAPGQNIMTCFYAIPFNYLDEFKENIINTVEFMKTRAGVPVEDYLPHLFKTKKLILWDTKIGIYGIVAPCRNKITQLW
jgi:hypothetical protein